MTNSNIFFLMKNSFLYLNSFLIILFILKILSWKKKILTSKKLFYNNDKEIALMLINFLKENEIKNENEIDQRLIQLFYDSLKN